MGVFALDFYGISKVKNTLVDPVSNILRTTLPIFPLYPVLFTRSTAVHIGPTEL